MPMHDWAKVEAGIFHDFHNAWVTELHNVLNGGLLPTDYYALIEQHAGRQIPDLLTLQAISAGADVPPPSGGVAVLEAPPRTRRKVVDARGATRRKTVVVRHISGHRMIAIVEIVSPANKDRDLHVGSLSPNLKTAFARHTRLTGRCIQAWKTRSAIECTARSGLALPTKMSRFRR